MAATFPMVIVARATKPHKGIQSSLTDPSGTRKMRINKANEAAFDATET